MAKQRSSSNQVRTARMLAAILDEPHDNPDDPGDVRLEQARQLLSLWNDAQSSLMAVLREVIILKAGFCVRCHDDPCPICGSTADSLSL
jgi:hypothetical protein